MSLWLQLAGYDKQTERLWVTHPVPEDLVEEARMLARVDTNDDGEGAYPLDTSAALKLGVRIGQTIEPNLYDWFLEPAQND